MTEHANLAAALAAFQAELPPIKKTKTAKVRTKDGGQYTYGYAGLPEVQEQVMPLLGKHGLSFTAKPTLEDGRFVLAYRLLHEGGDSEDGTYPLPAQGSAQEYGSAITYARRYALCSVVGVAAEDDDDGQAAKDRWEGDRADEQQLNADGFSDEIRTAKSGEQLTDVGKRLRQSVRSGGLTKAQYDRLAQEGSARRAEIDQAIGGAHDGTGDRDGSGSLTREASQGAGPDGERTGERGPGGDPQAGGLRPGVQPGVHRQPGIGGSAQAPGGHRDTPAPARSGGG